MRFASPSALRFGLAVTLVGVTACGGGRGALGDGGPSSGRTGGAAGGFPQPDGGSGGSPGDAGSGGSNGGATGATGGVVATGGIAGGAGSGGQPVGGHGGTTPVTCPSTAAAPAPLRNLTRFEYNNSLRDLFKETSRPADLLPSDSYTNVAEEMPRSPLVIEGYHTLAHNFAVVRTQDASAVADLLGCDPATAGEATCRQKLIGELVPRMFRRAPLPEDAVEFDEVFTTGARLGGGFAGGVRAVLEVALQSPEFLYRVELGEPTATAGVGRPTSTELATRLSYLLWGSTPDPALLAAAAAGQLSTREQVATQARRLLADARAHDVVRYFTFQLLHLHEAEYAPVDSEVFPGFTAELWRLTFEGTSRFIDEVTWQGPGTFRALMTSPVSFVNGPLATFYGVPGVSGDAFVKVTLDQTRRGGLLTQPGWLAARRVATRTSPTVRGASVLRELLCQNLEPPPPDIPTLPVPEPTGGTLRERLSAVTAAPMCQSCHRLTDSIGFTFEHYDAVGRWRDTDEGKPVDSSGQLLVGDVQGPLADAIELGAMLARSQTAQGCYVGTWMAFAYGRREQPADACTRQLLMDTFARTDGNVRELLVALTQTEAFLTRPLTVKP